MLRAHAPVLRYSTKGLTPQRMFGAWMRAPIDCMDGRNTAMPAMIKPKKQPRRRARMVRHLGLDLNH
ncbi:hypothetical protein ASD02_26310 [Ensifer sp. Root1252]|nr:hypothetical protein ASD02_26310 [Ensifer sp. Root1252]KRC77630.1 hypothetical protein ASE32_28605 [Ensifer sp. Root231]KRC99473.1 hypothetical protein ASE47_27215 [Ensifer sp. Root258]